MTRSLIWKYFQKKGDEVQCNLCTNAAVVKYQNTTNLWTHLASTHGIRKSDIAQTENLHTHGFQPKITSAGLSTILHALAKEFINNLRPISHVESPDFRKLCSSLHSGFTPPCSKTFRELLISYCEKVDVKVLIFDNNSFR